MSGLALTRRVGESIQIGADITITLIKIDHRQCRLVIDAPPAIKILRTELVGTPPKEKQS